jgi:hypothetical protein
MVANRALSPDSKLGMVEWIEKDVALGNEAFGLGRAPRAEPPVVPKPEHLFRRLLHHTASHGAANWHFLGTSRFLS